MYDSADTKRLSKELLVGVSQGGDSVQIQCTDVEDTEKTFNRLNVQRHRQQIKDIKINYNLVTFVLTIVQKVVQMPANQDIPVSPNIRTKRAKRTLLHAAPVEAYTEAAVAGGVDPEDLHAFAVETAEAINAMGGLEAANESARPWAEVKAELGLADENVDVATGVVPVAVRPAASRSQERRHAAQKAKPVRERVDPNDKPSTAPARKTQPATLPPLDLWAGKMHREKGKCFNCGGDCPCAPDRHYHQRVHEETSQRAYAVDICCHCVGHKVQS